MSPVRVRLYGDLNDFLPALLRQRTLAVPLDGPESVKSVVESCGVPHTEVDLLLVNGEPAAFETPIADGDRVAAFPRFRSIEPDAASRLQPPLQAEPRFVLDVHLGRLAGYLRLAGIDAAYRNDYADQALAEVSRDEDRVLLTRDRELLKRGSVRRGYWMRSTEPRRQFAEVVRAFALERRLAPFTRCARCNDRLEEVAKAAVAAEVPARVRESREHFLRCPACRRVYWEGTHVEKIRRFLRLALGEPPPA